MTLKIHALYHVDFEKLSYIQHWADNRGHNITTTCLFKNESLPELESFDWLIIMGGPMGLYEEAEYPWLVAEKQLIHRSIEAGKTVIGICLGAQLIAHSLGAEVTPSGIKEIGWMPIELTKQGKAHPLLQGLPRNDFNVFHWHGDGFEVPREAIPIARSKFWENQGFIYQNETHKQLDTWVMGWQCHFEVMPESMIDMVKFGTQYLEDSLIHYPNSVQSAEEILEIGEKYINNNNVWLTSILDNLAQTSS